MKQDLVAFLSGEAGLIASAGILGTVGIVGFVAFFRMLRPMRPPDRSRGSVGRRNRRSGHRSDRGGPDTKALQRLIAAALATGCLILPLAFTIALDDVFALPKTVVLRSLAMLLSALLALAVLRGARPRRFGILDIALLSFVGLSVGATVLSVDQGLSLGGERYQHQGLLSILAYVVLFVAARFSLAEVSHVRVLTLAVVVSATFSAVYAIAQLGGLDPIWDDLFKDRVFSTVGQANALASILAMAVVMAPALATGWQPRRRTVLVGAMVVIFVALLVTFSRGGYLALGIAIVASGLVLLPGGSWASIRPHAARVGIAAGIAAMLVLGATLTWRPAAELVGEITRRAASIADPTESSNRSHVDLWAVGLRIAADHPLLGTGPDSYVVVFPEYRDRVLPPDRAALMARFRPESPHEVYVAIAAGQGLPALAAYLTLIAGSLVLAGRAARTSMPAATRLALAGLVGAVVVHLVTDSFMTGEPSSTAIFWVALGAVAGLAGRIVTNDAAEQGREASR